MPKSQKNNVILNNISEYIGNTPLIRLDTVSSKDKYNIFAKCEYLNPGCSIQDRLNKEIIQEKIINGELKKNTIVNSISLNLVNDDNKKSNNKKNLLLFPNKNELCKKINITTYDTNKYYLNLAEEIYTQMNGKIDVIFISDQPNGSICGIGNRLKALIPDITIVGVMCMDEKDFSLKKELDKIPSVNDRGIVDVWSEVNTKSLIETIQNIISNEGLLCGKNSAALIKCASSYVKEFYKNKFINCVVILPDHLMNDFT